MAREDLIGKAENGQTRLALVLLPNFNLSATMNFVDPFRVANYLDGTPHFSWDFFSEIGGPLTASNGAKLDTKPLEAARAAGLTADLTVVSASWAPEAHISPRLRAFLRQAARRQSTLIGLDTGAFVLAHAGLLADHRATVHYEHIDAFQEVFPELSVRETLWEIDRGRITCAGGAAAGDLALHLLQGLKGAALSNAAARYIFAPRLRDHQAPQNPGDAEPLGATVPDKLRQAIRVMEAHLEGPLSMGEICDHINLSHRQLDRLFKRHVGKPPALYYRDIRLDRARGLVTQTSLSMAEIAVASGFSSQVHFSRAYRQRFGLPPSRDRVEGRIPFEFRAWPMHKRGKDGENG